MNLTELALIDTAGMMASADYKERFRAEHAQVAIRRRKLLELLEAWDPSKGAWDVDKLGFEPKCRAGLLIRQARLMGEYQNVLALRAEIEGIELGQDRFARLPRHGGMAHWVSPYPGRFECSECGGQALANYREEPELSACCPHCGEAMEPDVIEKRWDD